MQVDLSQAPAAAPAAEVPHEMLSVVHSDSGVKVRINYSSLAVLQKCAREAQYSLVRGLRPKLEQPALLFGSAIHKALETYYCGERTERLLPKNYRTVMEEIGCGQWHDEWNSTLTFKAARAFFLKAQPLTELPDDNKRSVTTGIWMLTHYFEKYVDDEYVIMRDSAGPVVERKFSLPLGNLADSTAVELFGTIDFVMKSEVTGQVLPGDHKTASSLWDFYDKVSPNHQYTGYVMAVRELLGYDTNLFLVNALEVKAPPKTSRGSPPNFARQVTERTEEDFRELKHAIFAFVAEHLRHRSADYFPQSASGACTGFYGSCRFREVCAAPPSLRESIISAKFNEGSAT